MVVARAGQTARVGPQRLAPTLNFQLQFQEFVQREPLPGKFDIAYLLRKMDQVYRAGSRRQRVCFRLPAGRSRTVCRSPDQSRPRLDDLRLVCFEHAPDQRAQPPLRQPFGQRIDRHDAIEMDEVFFTRLDQFRFRMVERARLERNGPAVNQDFVTRVKVLFHERKVPPAAMQPRCAVLQDKFKHRLAPAAPPFCAERDDFSARSPRLAQCQIGDGPKPRSVFVASRPMHQQVARGMNFQPRQLRHALGTNAAQCRERRVERMGWQLVRHDDAYSVQSPKSKVQSFGA